MKHGALFVSLGLPLLAAPLFAQQPLPPGAALPPGHPPMAAPAPAGSGAAPPGHPPAASAALPPAHPPIGKKPADSRHFVAPSDRSERAPDLPRGSIEAIIADADENPVGGIEVRLGILKQSIAEGESRDEQRARADASGKVRFSGLGIGTALSYRITVAQQAATYASAPINLGEEGGHRVLLHVYPVTRDIQKALVGLRGFVFIEPREDVLQLEVMFRIFNIGANTWVPERAVVALPKRSKAVTAPESMSDVRFEAKGDTVELGGTIAPGQYDASYRFQVPHGGDSTVDLRVPLPPHVAEMQVVVERNKGMALSVRGFDDAVASEMEGKPVLAAGRKLTRGAPALEQLEIAISGLPTQGPGRRWAAAIALAILLGGGWTALRRPPREKARALAKELRDARAILLDELVAVEHASRSGVIGPKTRERARRMLLDALTRLPQAAVDNPRKSLRKRSDQARDNASR